MKRDAMPELSEKGQAALAAFEKYLREEVDLSKASVRNYISDMRQFIAWCEQDWSDGQDEDTPFSPQAVATPTLTAYRAFLQNERGLKPASVNRYLVSLKRYFDWAVDAGIVQRDPAKPVKLVGEVRKPPRHLTDQEEAALMAAVEAGRDIRDRTLVIVMLHTGLRAGEICVLKRDDVAILKRSGYLKVRGKRNKYREVPLNSTARAALTEYLEMVQPEGDWLFTSTKTGEGLTPRAVGYIIRKYARAAHVPNLSPHDLRHRFGYRMAENVPLHRLAQIMGHDSLDTTLLYVQGTARDLQRAVENIAWE